jgi:hypothetical protein
MKRTISPTGLALWSGLPGTGLTIMWPGPGSHLLFGQCTVPNGKVGRISHPTADDVYNTLSEATAAVNAFVAVLKEAGW